MIRILSLTILVFADRLLNNPWAQPPLPADWEVSPTYPRHVVPYYLAPLWDQDMAARAGAEKKKREVARKQIEAEDQSTGKIPRELREKLKKAKAAKGLLKDLEEQIRLFVKSWEDQTTDLGEHELDSEDEEIVFVGRNGQMNDIPSSPKVGLEESDAERDQRMVFNSLANDQGASFGHVACCTLLNTKSEADFFKALAGPLDCILLRPPHMVHYCRRSGEARSVCWNTAAAKG